MLEVIAGSLRRLLAGAALAIPGFAAAVDPPPEPVRPDFLPPASQVPFELPAVPALPADVQAGISPKRVAAITFSGNTAISTAELDALARPYVGRTLGGAEIEELRQKLTRLHVDRGYVNSGAVVRGLSADGVLAFEIVEGRLAAMRLRGLGDLDERYVVRRLARDSDRPFNVDVLRERFQLLLGDPLFERMSASIIPGSRLGEAILDVDVERAKVSQLTVYANNHRPPSIGANGAGLRGWIRNLTGFGDVVEGSIEDSIRWDSGIRLGLAASVPLNARGTTANARYDRGRSSVVEEPLQVLGIKSLLESAEAGLAQMLVETLRMRVAVGASYLWRENRTWLLGIPFSFTPGEPEGRIETHSVRLWQEFTHRSEADALVVRSTFSHVRSNLRKDPLAEGQPEGRYRMWLGQAQYARRLLDNGTQLVLRATVQHTRHRLLALDGLPIGGAATVRGYRENQLIRDKARIFNAEVEVPVYRNPDRALSLALAPFFDYGRGRNRGAEPATLSSFGVAARARWSRFTLNFAVARRAVHPESVDALHGTLQDRGVHFDLAYDLP